MNALLQENGGQILQEDGLALLLDAPVIRLVASWCGIPLT